MAKITVFRDDNFRGQSTVLTGPVPDLQDLPRGDDGDWGDQISSIIVEEGTWGLYEDDSFEGDTWQVNEARGKYPNPSDWGGSHDNISSLRPL